MKLQLLQQEAVNMLRDLIYMLVDMKIKCIMHKLGQFMLILVIQLKLIPV